MEWNSLIHPQMGPLRPFARGNKCVKNVNNYKYKMSGELTLDMKL